LTHTTPKQNFFKRTFLCLEKGAKDTSFFEFHENQQAKISNRLFPCIYFKAPEASAKHKSVQTPSLHPMPHLPKSSQRTPAGVPNGAANVMWFFNLATPGRNIFYSNNFSS
jgi:hypothetical protein